MKYELWKRIDYTRCCCYCSTYHYKVQCNHWQKKCLKRVMFYNNRIFLETREFAAQLLEELRLKNRKLEQHFSAAVCWPSIQLEHRGAATGLWARQEIDNCALDKCRRKRAIEVSSTDPSNASSCGAKSSPASYDGSSSDQACWRWWQTSNNSQLDRDSQSKQFFKTCSFPPCPDHPLLFSLHRPFPPCWDLLLPLRPLCLPLHPFLEWLRLPREFNSPNIVHKYYLKLVPFKLPKYFSLLESACLLLCKKISPPSLVPTHIWRGTDWVLKTQSLKLIWS